MLKKKTALLAVFLAACFSFEGALYAQDLTVGMEVQIATKGKLRLKKGKTTPVQPGDKVVIEKVKGKKAYARRQSDGAAGWIPLKKLQAAAGAPAAPPSSPPIVSPPVAEPITPPAPVAEPTSKVPVAAVAEVKAVEPVQAPAKKPSRRAIRVAVYEFQTQGVDERLARVVTNSMVAELRKLERVGTVGMDEIADMLTHEENKQMLGCEDDSCMAEIAGALGVDELITGSIGQVGDSSVYNVRRINMLTAKVLHSVNQRLTPGDGEEFLAVIGPSVEELYPEHSLKPGKERGVSEQVAMALNPPPLPTWAFWATTGLAAGVTFLGGAAAVLTQVKYNDWASYRDQGQKSTIEGSRIVALEEETRAWNNATIGLLAGAGVLILGAGLEALFTDWYGYGNSEL